MGVKRKNVISNCVSKEKIDPKMGVKRTLSQNWCKGVKERLSLQIVESISYPNILPTSFTNSFSYCMPWSIVLS